MFYRIDQITNKAVEEFNTMPNFHADVMANIIESSQVPTDNDIWNGTEFVPEYTDEELLEQAKQGKYPSIYAHADSLIEAQEATFFSKGSNRGRNKDRLLKQQNKRNNKKIKGQSLNPKEEAEDDRYDSFMDWADTIYDEADLAEDAVEAMSDINNVKAYDVVNDPNWSEWTE